MSQFQLLAMGFGGPVVDIDNRTVSDLDAGTVTVVYQLRSDGTVWGTLVGSTSYLEDWITPASAAGADYEAHVTYTGDAIGGTTSTWVSLDSNRQWSLTRAREGASEAVLTVQIRNASTLDVLDTATVTLQAEYLGGA